MKVEAHRGPGVQGRVAVHLVFPSGAVPPGVQDRLHRHHGIMGRDAERDEGV